jgi:hypothetical protein
MPTARELADRVIESRGKAWSKSDPTIAIMATQQLSPDDALAVRHMVEEAGFKGEERERIVRQVSALVIGQVQALADNMPATAGD